MPIRKTCADDCDRQVLEVDFQSRTTSKTRWTAKFDLGTAKENSAAAVEAAWKLNADITGQRCKCGNIRRVD